MNHIEDIKAMTQKDAKKWNISFSPLEVGKTWLYSEVKKFWNLYLVQGYETKEWVIWQSIKRVAIN